MVPRTVNISTENPLALRINRVGPLVSGIAKTTTVKLRYYTDRTLADPGVGGCVYWVFRANSIYDPDQSGIGSQPRGTDQYFALYNKATVLASKIFVNAIGSASGGVFGATIRPTTSGSLVPKEYIEDPLTSYAYSNSNTTINLSCINSFSAKQYFNVKDPLDEEDLKCTAASDPSKQAYWHVWSGAYTAASDPVAPTVNVLIEYTVEFSEPAALPSS